MTGLSPVTTYYVRAYATNTAGTAYGSEKSFTTLPSIGPGTYFVKVEGGDDSNDGSLAAQAWKTMHYAIAQINGGSTGTPRSLHVAAGNYNSPNGEANTNIVLSQSNVTVTGTSGVNRF